MFHHSFTTNILSNRFVMFMVYWFKRLFMVNSFLMIAKLIN